MFIFIFNSNTVFYVNYVTCGFDERSFLLALDNHLKLKARGGDKEVPTPGN